MLSPSITFAFLAMVLMGTGDTINKRARQANIPIGSYLLIQSLFFICVILIIALASTGIQFYGKDIIYGLISAFFSFAAYTLMLHSLTHGYASINYAIFRLSFIFSSGVAILFLYEEVTLNKGIGIGLATCAIILFLYNPQRHVVTRKALTLAIVAMILAACWHITLKLATQVYSSTPSFLLLTTLFFSSMVIVYNIFSGRFQIPRKTFLFAPANGILMALGAFFFLAALSKDEVSTVTPIVQLSFLITLVLSVLFLKEKINSFQIVGIICAAIAIVVLGVL
ncbi:MAG: EamA family transporter [candidate division WOR-3 bacterium]|nr:MAG: EamA family transporter [candidate division WOR-3 bacterium]